MEKNHSPFAIVEIGAGIICLLMALSDAFLETISILTIQMTFLGAALLFYGLSNNKADTSERGKMMVNAASICIIIAAILSFLNYYYRHK